MPVFYAVVILAIPILDTTAAVWRRARDGRPLGSPDKFHVHHKLMNLGLSVRKIDAVLFGLQAIISVLVIVSLKQAKPWSSLVALIFACLLAIAFFTVLHFMNKRDKPQCLGYRKSFPGCVKTHKTKKQPAKAQHPKARHPCLGRSRQPVSQFSVSYRTPPECLCRHGTAGRVFCVCAGRHPTGNG